MTKKIIVLGATGFIGSSLTDYLKNQKQFEIWGSFRNNNFEAIDNINYFDLRKDVSLDFFDNSIIIYLLESMGSSVDDNVNTLKSYLNKIGEN